MISFFLEYLKAEKRYSSHTVIAYKKDLEDYKKYVEERNQELLSINRKQIQNYIISLSEKKISITTINRKISSIKTFYKYLHYIGEVNKNPTIGISNLKKSTDLVVPLSRKEIDFKLTRELFPPNFKGLRDFLIIQMLYQTGIRRAELIGLKCKDIHLEKREIKVLGKRNKERILPLTRDLYLLINEYISHEKLKFALPDSPLFFTKKGKTLYPKFVYNVVNTYLSIITNKKKTSPHILRHTFATHMLNNGADINTVKELLGHSSLASTQVYTHNDIGQLKKVFNKAHPKCQKK